MNYDKKIIILIGPIGSGKDTQADILADKLHLFRLRTSQLLENKFNNVKPDDSDYEQLQKEKALWANGILNTPEWVLSVVREKVKEVASGGQGIIFSGSCQPDAPSSRNSLDRNWSACRMTYHYRVSSYYE